MLEAEKKEIQLMLQKFPYLVSINSFRKWTGFVKIGDCSIHLCLECPNFPLVEDLEISVLHDLQVLSSVFDKEIMKIKQEVSSLADFLDRFCHYMEPIIEQCFVADNHSDVGERDLIVLQQVLSEVQQIGYHNVKYLSGVFDDISLKAEDDNGSVHTISVRISQEYPIIRPSVIDVELPDACFNEISKQKTIKAMYQKFCDTVKSLQTFWLLFSSLYSECTIVDPETMKFSDTECKIALCNGVLLTVIFNPFDPFSCPELKLHGSEKATAPWRSTLEANLTDIGWEPQKQFMENLLSLLGLEEFPKLSRSSIGISECGVCLMMKHDDNTFPIKLCTNDSCAAYFHNACLAKWFLQIPMNQPSFDIITGPCPNCTKKISCPVN